MCQRIQCDEIWPFRYAKAKNVATRLLRTPGVAVEWTVLCANRKLLAARHIAHDRDLLEDAATSILWSFF